MMCEIKLSNAGCYNLIFLLSIIPVTKGSVAKSQKKIAVEVAPNNADSFAAPPRSYEGLLILMWQEKCNGDAPLDIAKCAAPTQMV